MARKGHCWTGYNCVWGGPIASVGQGRGFCSGEGDRKSLKLRKPTKGQVSFTDGLPHIAPTLFVGAAGIWGGLLSAPAPPPTWPPTVVYLLGQTETRQ